MQTLPYGAWRSPITSDLIVAGSIGLSAVQLDGDDIYWIESRPAEGGRNVLVRNGTDVTPAPYNTRTRVHEYGGGTVTADRGIAYFTNFTDQRLYRAAPGAAPEPVTPEGGGLRHADGAIDRTRNRWIGIREEHAAGGRVDNLVVAVEFDRVNAGRVLAQGCDFYAAPRLSPDGKRLAFVSWNHPNMPWVGTELWVADITEDGGLASPRRVAGGDRESVAQPLWSPDGVLHFISDRSGWWNLYRFDGETARPICPRAAEFAGAQWVLGQASYAFLGADRLICTIDDGGRSVLARLEISSGRLTPLSLPFAAFGSIQARNGRIVCLAGSATGPGAVVSIDAETGAYDILRRSSDTSEWERYFSVAQHVEFPTA